MADNGLLGDGDLPGGEKDEGGDDQPTETTYQQTFRLSLRGQTLGQLSAPLPDAQDEGGQRQDTGCIGHERMGAVEGLQRDEPEDADVERNADRQGRREIGGVGQEAPDHCHHGAYRHDENGDEHGMVRGERNSDEGDGGEADPDFRRGAPDLPSLALPHASPRFGTVRRRLPVRGEQVHATRPGALRRACAAKGDAVKRPAVRTLLWMRPGSSPALQSARQRGGCSVAEGR